MVSHFTGQVTTDLFFDCVHSAKTLTTTTIKLATKFRTNNG